MSLFQVTKKQVIENYELRTMTGDIVSFTPSYSQLLPDPFSDLNVTVNVEATGGNGTPDSPIPINGYTEANITRCGVNLWDEEWRNGYYDASGVFHATPTGYTNLANTNPIIVKPNTNYYFKTPQNNSNTVCWYDGNMDLISANTNVTFNTVIQSPANAKYLNVKFNYSGVTEPIYNNDCSINYPSTDTTYHPYTGNTSYTISFGQTVYGGVLDVTRGKLHVTHKIVDLGDLNWVNENDTQTGLCRASSQFTDCVWQSAIICSGYKYNSTTSYNGLSDGDIALTNSESIPLLRIRNTAYSTYTNAQIKEAVTGMKLVYQTKTPFDIDLTPKVISAVVGTNNVFADCGETTVTCLI